MDFIYVIDQELAEKLKNEGFRLLSFRFDNGNPLWIFENTYNTRFSLEYTKEQYVGKYVLNDTLILRF